MGNTIEKAPASAKIAHLPQIRISGWTARNAEGVNVEKGLTFSWHLPVGERGMTVIVDGASWGNYPDSPRAVNVPYPDPLAGQPSKVEFRFTGRRRTAVFWIYDPLDRIHLVEDDLPIICEIDPENGDICPVDNYPEEIPVDTYTSGVRKIIYADKDSSGLYKAVLIIITAPNDDVASCILDPGPNPESMSERAVDHLIVEEACRETLLGAFTEETTPSPISQKYAQTSLASETINIKAFRDYELDKMIIHVETTHTVQAFLAD